MYTVNMFFLASPDSAKGRSRILVPPCAGTGLPLLHPAFPVVSHMIIPQKEPFTHARTITKKTTEKQMNITVRVLHLGNPNS